MQETTSTQSEFSTPLKKKLREATIKPDTACLSTNRTLKRQENNGNRSSRVSKETPTSEPLASGRYVPNSSPAKYYSSMVQNISNRQIFGLFSPYIDDIFDHFLQIEDSYTITLSSLFARNQIDERMRAMLVNWLVGMQVNFTLRTQTLYLAVSLFDRYISQHSVPVSSLQLLGITLLFIASKYEDPYSPLLQDLLESSSKKYTKEEVIRYEGQVLSDLEFKLPAPSSLSFVYHYSQRLECSETVIYLARYLLELGLLEPRMLAFKPSLLALTALYISCIYHGVGKQKKFETFEHGIDAVKECGTVLFTGFQKYHRSRTFSAVRDKYSKENFEKVAKLDVMDLVIACESYIVIKEVKWSAYF